MITYGNVTITHAESDVFEVWGKKVKMKKPLKFAMMKIDGETVMSETPQETEAMKDDAKSAKGRALVAGLGLGVILQYMRKKCALIDVVEPNQNVIDAYREFRGGKVQYDSLFKNTIEDFLDVPGLGDKYDYIYLDTWYGLDPEYLPHINWTIEGLKRRLTGKGVIKAWGYDVMVRGFVKDCMDLAIGKKKEMLTAHPENMKRLALTFPLLGAFANWMRANPKVSRNAAKTQALSMALSVARCPVPLNTYKDWCLIQECHMNSTLFKKLVSNGEFDQIQIQIGGKIWRPA